MKPKLILIFVIVTCFSFLFFNCGGTSGIFSEGNLTEVQLSQGNFTIAAKDVHGESSAAYILGGSMSSGMNSTVLALFKVSGTNHLYTDALNNLWKDFEKSNGSIAGKKYALVNVRYDSNVLNLFLYTTIAITVRADVVEFAGQ